MIVECPKCGSRYRLGEDRKREEEVQVRCGACKTVFKIVKPAHVGETAAGQPGAPSGKERILVCDDALFFRTMLEEILTGDGYTVELAASGEEALSKVVEVRPALLILDLQLPGMSGFEVLKVLRDSESSKDLPVLAMSAVYTDSSDIMELEDVGADDYIGKKFKAEHLLRRVRNLLGSAAGT
jgi:predicted Zn finger-like uncharacterized protein